MKLNFSLFGSFVFIATGFFSESKASTILDPSDGVGVVDADYQNLGSLFPTVGQVEGNGFLDGSGVLIGDRWVLTAGHIGAFATTATFTVGGVDYPSSNIFTHPSYSFSFSASANDLALVELASPVLGVTPVSLFDFGSPNEILGTEATWVGFGLGGTGLTGGSGNVAKRGFTNVIDSQGQFGLPGTAFLADFDRPDGSENSDPGSSPVPTTLEGSLTPGDSGGGVFMEIGGVEYLVGINSFQAALDSNANGDYGDLSGATNLALYTDWITSVSGITPVPEPRAVLLVFLSLSLLFKRKRSAYFFSNKS